jgi:hypothetical protein
MKLVNEKGKLFGLINPVDLIILLVVIVVVAAIGVRLLGSQVADKVAPQVTLTAEVVIVGTPPRIQDEIARQDLIGQRIVAGNEYMPATITGIKTEPYVVQAFTDDGRIVDAVDPSKHDVVFTIETKVAKGTPSPKIGSQELRAGKTFILKTQTFESIGTIRYVQIDE